MQRAIVDALLEFQQTNDAKILDQILNDPEVRRPCEHGYPWHHRLFDVDRKTQDADSVTKYVRVSRCTICSERVYLSFITSLDFNEEPGIPLLLHGRALSKWAQEENESPSEDSVNWELVRWRFMDSADVNRLVAILESGDVVDQIEVAKVLGEIGNAASVAIPNLMSAMRSSNQRLRLAATIAVARIRREPSVAVREVTTALETFNQRLLGISTSRNHWVGEVIFEELASGAVECIETLEWMGDAAAPALPTLRQLRTLGLADEINQRIDALIARMATL